MSGIDMDVIRDFLRGAVRLHVLHHAALGAVSGAWISEELGRHGYEISPGTLYPLLHDLEAQGLLVSVQRTENGRVLRYYDATGAGRAVLAEARRALAELAGELLPARLGNENRPLKRPATKGTGRSSTVGSRRQVEGRSG